MRLINIFKMAAFIAFATASFAVCSAENWRERASAEEELAAEDVEAEVAFGREIAARILGRYKIYNDSALLRYVNLVGLSLVRSTNRAELDFHFAVLDTPEVNAYAAPGGYVFITAGALKMMKDESELAGALAHEIGHITEMHVVKELKIKGENDSVTSGFAKLVGGSSESVRAAFNQAVDKGLEIIFKDGYKREDELQADKTAVIACALGGYDPAGLSKFLERTRAIKEKIPDPDSTHPTVDVRIAQINEVIAANGMETGSVAANQKRFVVAMKGLK
jgi:predicted Zn-dependent protease